MQNNGNYWPPTTTASTPPYPPISGPSTHDQNVPGQAYLPAARPPPPNLPPYLPHPYTLSQPHHYQQYQSEYHTPTANPGFIGEYRPPPYTYNPVHYSHPFPPRYEQPVSYSRPDPIPYQQYHWPPHSQPQDRDYRGPPSPIALPHTHRNSHSGSSLLSHPSTSTPPAEGRQLSPTREQAEASSFHRRFSTAEAEEAIDDDTTVYDTTPYWDRIERAIMASSDPFADYHEYLRMVPRLKVDTLKSIIRELNSSLGCGLAISGVKSSLVSRITDQLAIAKERRNAVNYGVVKTAISRADRGYSAPSPAYRPPAAHAPPPPLPRPAASSSTNRAAAPVDYLGNGSLHGTPGFHTRPSSHSVKPEVSNPIRPTQGQYGAVGQPRQAAVNSGSSVSGSHGAVGQGLASVRKLPIVFKSSPFYQIEEVVSGVVRCDRAAQGDRKTGTFAIQLTPEHRQKLEASRSSPSNPQYQLRFFCTSEDFYNLAFQVSHRPQAIKAAPIDFPLTCELKLNDVVLTANTRGIKKQPGTAPPPELTKLVSPRGGGTSLALRLEHGVTNRFEMVYVNTEKRYYGCVYLVEYLPVDKVLQKLKNGKSKTKQEILEQITKAGEDDDIVMSSSVLDLKDSLSMCRIGIPMRSMQCSHLQCFDAETFLTLMEGTPTWKCPVCSKVLEIDQLYIDGYSQDILKLAPNCDSVIVEADGTWHDEANRVGNSSSVRLKPAAHSISDASSIPSPALTSDEKGKRKATEDVTVLDDDDDDDDDEEDRLWGVPPSKKARTNSGMTETPRRGPSSSIPAPPIVIDLTDSP